MRVGAVDLDFARFEMKNCQRIQMPGLILN